MIILSTDSPPVSPITIKTAYPYVGSFVASSLLVGWGALALGFSGGEIRIVRYENAGARRRADCFVHTSVNESIYICIYIHQILSFLQLNSLRYYT